MSDPTDPPAEETEIPAEETPTPIVPPTLEEWRERVVKTAFLQGTPFAEGYEPPAELYDAGLSAFEACTQLLTP